MNRRLGMVCALVMVSADLQGARAAASSRTVVSPSMAEAMIEMRRTLARVREHGFKADVPVETMTEAQVRLFLLDKLQRDYPDEKIAREQETYVHFGFLKPGEDLKRLFVQLLVEQAAGFYDPDDKRLFLVAGRPLPGMALVHELAHVLQDQTFGVMGILDRARDNDDALLAAQSMIEGEATYLSDVYMSMHPGGEDPMGEDADVATVPVSGARNDVETPEPIPEILKANLMFPYTQGMTWAGAVVRKGGEKTMDSMFRHPPESTEQILHPEKSQPPRDLPSEIKPEVLSRLAPILAAGGYREVKVNTLGEFNILQLFGGRTDPGAADAAAGWDGDSFEIVERPAGGTAMIWISVWDSNDDAAAFRARAASWLASRHPGGGGWITGPDGPAGPAGRIVWMLEGFEPAPAATIAASLAGALAQGADGPRGVRFR
ncbi:MAG TPA: hypothetical protein VFE84_09200 [Patescibacteria group bacterium]|nr:hypothetical protein [Patescibacteria group bacterium]